MCADGKAAYREIPPESEAEYLEYIEAFKKRMETRGDQP